MVAGIGLPLLGYPGVMLIQGWFEAGRTKRRSAQSGPSCVEDLKSKPARPQRGPVGSSALTWGVRLSPSGVQGRSGSSTAGIRPLRFSVRASRTSAGPGMARAVENPMLEHRVSAVIAHDRAGIACPAWSLTAADRLRPEVRARLRLGNHLVPIDRVYCRVVIAMKHDGRHQLASPHHDEAPRPAAWRHTPRACYEQPHMRAPSGTPTAASRPASSQ